MATSKASRHLPPYHNLTRPAVSRKSHIQPTGNGHQFSYSRSNRFAQLSPQSSSEDDDEDDDDEQGDEDVDRESSDAESSGTDMPRSSSDEGEEEEEDDDDDDDDDDDSNAHDDDEYTAHDGVKAGNNRRRPQSNPSEDRDKEEDELELDQPTVLSPAVERANRSTSLANLTVEELSDFDPMDQERAGVIGPTSIEYPDTERSRSRSRDIRSSASKSEGEGKSGSGSESGSGSDSSSRRQYHHSLAYANLTHRPRRSELDRNMMSDLRNLNCTASEASREASPAVSSAVSPEAFPRAAHPCDVDANDEEDDFFDPADDAALKEFARMQREIKMRKRRSHGSSIGKRTHSERSDSDGLEDLIPFGDDMAAWDAVGASARRLRRRVGDRRSLQFQDPPPERIEELEEPSSGEEYAARLRMTRGFGMLFGDGEALARELPYYAMEIDEDI
ncbi:hypothetical protein SODALDRAFT_320306 [Sodiomyces alkalinus F11]|uniref:Uncharacterized protein n=1 Tax=Sodiomyces alkalinus (strain CBS 110278 / VKM F-3762 / F11) TaxID=1314773 RepID=A0A3N2PMZ2_SODAK|nr:hypothetical protein SODALDRAFT_320306 [Sodiomyces alkalinus F11]ROT35800.1 hypothetical protein SODALDRAFT_320306 [Sodiomyces alkalinus F11]